MERRLWKRVYQMLQEFDHQREPGERSAGVVYSGVLITAVSCWAVLHDRTQKWAFHRSDGTAADHAFGVALHNWRTGIERRFGWLMTQMQFVARERGTEAVPRYSRGIAIAVVRGLFL